jgi:hypothetical protein
MLRWARIDAHQGMAVNIGSRVNARSNIVNKIIADATPTTSNGEACVR